MKLAHIIPNLETGGAEKLIVDSLGYYKNLIERVDLIVLQKTNSPFFLELSKKYNIISLSEGSVYNPFLIFKLIKYLRRYDIIHLHLFPVLYWGVIAKMISLSTPKLIYTEHSTYNKRREKKILKIVEKIIYNRLDFIGCISAATKKYLIHHLNYKKSNIQVISNGIDLSKFENKESHNYNYFDKGDFILIQVSSFRPQKDQATLIRSLELLPEEIKLLLVGDGALKDDCFELVKKLNLEHRVKFLGIRTDISELLCYADVSVLSSNYEGFGLAAVEGMAAHKPVIASKIEGIDEVVGKFGLLFDRGNEEQLSEMVCKLYYDKEYYKKIADSCYKRSENFNINKMVDSYFNVYKNLIQ